MARCPISFQISPQACIFAAAALLTLPLRWIAAAVAAAAVHEACHLAALYFGGVKVYSLRIGVCGAVIETEPVTPAKEALCALAGPVGSFSLILLGHMFPEIAFCAVIQGVFNLLPIYPMDGGRVLRSLLTLLWPRRGEAVFSGIEVSVTIVLTGVLIAASWMLRWHLGIFLAAVFILHRVMGRKIPCKAARKRVQ